MRKMQGQELKKAMENQGIIVKVGFLSGLAEEAPAAYKDINEVVEVVHQAGLAKKVVQLKPLAVIKG
jgi:tRNA-splicing ligase RtcB